MNNVIVGLLILGLIGSVLSFVRLSQRGERSKWIMLGVVVLLALSLVIKLSKRHRTVEIAIPGELIQQAMHNSRAAARPEKKLSLEEALKEIDGSMVSLPGGTFIMGSPGTEAGRNKDEGPQHKVMLAPFEMGKYEVTQAQWQAVATLPKVKIDLTPNPSAFEGDDLPVEQVSWDEAVEFCARLSQATGKNYRLPTEAEWEYAARAMTTGSYIGVPDETAWYESNSGYKTHPVGTKQANGFGLYDMSGNVAEWCGDRYSENYYSQSTSANPTGPGKGFFRVTRGGCWRYAAPALRSAHRGWEGPGYSHFDVGCRLVRTSN